MSEVKCSSAHDKVEASDDENEIKLSSHTLAALNEFLAEKTAREEQLRQLAEREDKEEILDIDLEENWQLSQFWYDDSTSKVLAHEALKVAGEKGSIACISCPTLYKYLRKVKPKDCIVKLLEFDKRFSTYGDDYIPYDYNAPLEIPQTLQSAFDVVVADPPFLADECLTKTAVTIRYLSKGPLILCTGAVMEELASRLLHLKMCEFQPKHRNNLANDFRCYANFDFDPVEK